MFRLISLILIYLGLVLGCGLMLTSVLVYCFSFILGIEFTIQNVFLVYLTILSIAFIKYYYTKEQDVHAYLK